MLDEFPLFKLNEINWVDKIPDTTWFETKLNVVIKDLLQGNFNSCMNDSNNP